MNVKCYEHDVDVNSLIAAKVIKQDDESVTKIDKTFYYNGLESLPCEMINVLRARPDLFQSDVVKGKDYWHVYNSIPHNNSNLTTPVGVIKKKEKCIQESFTDANTFVITFAPAFSKALAESYSQFVPGNTGINTVGFATLFLHTYMLPLS